MAAEEAKIDAVLSKAGGAGKPTNAKSSAPASTATPASSAADEASFRELEAYVQGASLFFAALRQRRCFRALHVASGLGKLDDAELDVDSDTDADVLFEELSKELGSTVRLCCVPVSAGLTRGSVRSDRGRGRCCDSH